MQWAADVSFVKNDECCARDERNKKALYYDIVRKTMILCVDVKDQEESEEVPFTYITHGNNRNVYRGWSAVLNSWLIWKIHPMIYESNMKEAGIYHEGFAQHAVDLFWVGSFKMGVQEWCGSLQREAPVLSLELARICQSDPFDGNVVDELFRVFFATISFYLSLGVDGFQWGDLGSHNLGFFSKNHTVIALDFEHVVKCAREVPNRKKLNLHVKNLALLAGEKLPLAFAKALYAELVVNWWRELSDDVLMGPPELWLREGLHVVRLRLTPFLPDPVPAACSSGSSGRRPDGLTEGTAGRRQNTVQEQSKRPGSGSARLAHNKITETKKKERPAEGSTFVQRHKADGRQFKVIGMGLKAIAM